MRKQFLLVFLLAVLPLMGWATGTIPKTNAVPADGWTYDKASHDLLKSKLVLPDDYDTSVGKVYYIALTGPGSPISSNPNWSESIPQGTGAGTYHLFYKITNDGTTNHDEETIKPIGDVTVNPKTAVAGTDFTAPTAATGLVYDGTAKALLNVEAPAGGHFVYQVRQRNLQNSGWVAGWPSSSTWQTELPEGTNGTGYVVRYRYVNDDGNYVTWGNTNYVTIPSSGYINIEKVTPTVTAPEANELEYTGSAQTLLKTAAVADYGNVQYRITNAPLIGGGGTWGPGDFASIPQRTAAGNYTIQYRVSPGGTTSPGYNWTTTAWETITVTIANAEPTITTTGELVDDLEYTSAAQPLLKTPVAVNVGNIRYYINKDGAGDGAAITNPAQVTGLDAGEYEVSYDVDVTGISLLNYKDAGKKSLGKVKIEKAKLTIANVGYTKDFDNTEFGATTENVIKFVDGIGWVGTEGSDEDLKAEVLGKLIKHVNGLPQINVGGYKVLLESQDDPTVNYTVDPLFHAEADLNILKIKNSWKNDVSIASTWAYGSTPATPTAEPNLTKKENGEDAEITYKYYTDDLCTKEFTGAIDKTMPVGVYYVKAFVEGCNNFFELESVTAASFEITATSPTWTKPVKMAGWEYTKYNATTNAPIAEVIDDATITFKYYEDAACTTEIAAEDVPTLGVGKYYVKAFAAATANHTADENGPAEFEVTPTELPEITLTYEFTYNATDQNPGRPAIGDDIKAETGLERTVDFTLNFKPEDEFIHAGEYTIVVKGKGNYAKEVDGKVNTKEVKVTIKQAVVTAEDLIIAEKGKNLTYNNTDQALVEPAAIAPGIVEGTFYYKLSTDADDKWNTDVPTGFNAGDYTVQTKFVPTDDFEEYTAIVETPAKIEQAQLKITLTNTFEKPWDGLEIDDITETYIIDGLLGDDAYVIPFTLTLPATEENNFIDAKVYELKKLNITWTDENVQNYKIAFTTVGSVTINKAEIETADFDAPYAYDDLVYTGAEQVLVEKGVMNNDYGTILYYQGEKAPAEDSEDWTATVPAKTEAGDYPVWYMVKGDANHKNKVAEKALAGKIAGFDLKDVEITMSEDAKYKKTNQKPEYTLTYKVDDETSLPLKEGTDFVVKVTNKAGEEVTDFDNGFINADKYKFTFTAVQDKDGNYTGNYTGTNSATYTINPFEVIAEALPTSKVYNGLAGKELRADETYANGKTEIVVKYGGLFEGDEDAISAEDAISIEKASRNVGDYEIVLDKDAFVSQNYIITDVTGAMFQITPAALTINWNDADPGFSKVYGEDDPALTATIDNLVIEGAGDGDEDDIIAYTVITRAEGENVGKYGITLSAYKDAKGNIAPVFKNYTFDTPFDTADEAFAITEAGVKVSIAPQYVTFTGKTAVIEVTADKLVITGLENEDDKAKVFEGGKLPEITIPEDAVNVGEYKVTLANGKSLNYTIEYLPSYITVEPVLVKGVFTTIPVAAVGVKGQEILDNTVWSVEAADAADAATVENYSDQFELNIDESILDKDGKIKTEDGEDALFIVYTGSPENFVMDPETDSADLNIGGKDTEIALDDSAPVVTYKSEKGTTVTFTQSRAVAEDKWQACVLPCTVSIEDFSNAFGYAAVDLFDKSRTNADEIHFSLQVTGNIEAGVPFLFKANKDTNFNEIEIENATMANTADLNTVVEDDDTDIKFIGTFEGVNLTTAGYRYISKGSWYATKDDQAKPYVIKPLRAYLDLGTKFTGARIFIEEPDGTVTAIDTITLEGNNAEGLYNLNGMKVNQGLKGVYIQNGKKVIKK